MGFIGYAMGTVLVAGALSSAGIGPAFLALVLWVLFGYFFGLPPLIGLLSTWELWDPKEAIQGFVVQAALFVGALWAFEAAGLGNLTVLFVVFSAIQGVMMAPGMIQEKKDEVKRLQSEMLGRKERRMLIDLAGGLIADNPEAIQSWQRNLKSHELMKNDPHYLDGFGGDAQEMELQISLMKEILQVVQTLGQR